MAWWKPWTWGRGKERLSSGYEAGRTGTRRRAEWNPTGASADAEWSRSADVLRRRARDAVRNDPHATRAVSLLAGNLVGTGLLPQFESASTNRNVRLAKLWKEWAKSAGVGRMSVGGVQDLAARAAIESGDVFIIRQWRSDVQGVPLRLRVLEADMLDTTHRSMRDLAEGHRLVDGVELDANDEPVAYWFHRAHPGDSVWLGVLRESIRVPAADVAHFYVPLRPGQHRGFPFLAPVLDDMRDLDDYELAEIVRKKVEACIAAVVIPGEGEVRRDPRTTGEGQIAPTLVDSDGRVIEQLEPGIVASLEGGKEIKFLTPTTQSDPEWRRGKLRSMAVGVGLTYEQLAGDLSQVNYTSYRAGAIDFRRDIERLRLHWFEPWAMDPIARWFVEAAFVAGLVDQPRVPVAWSSPRWQSVDPVKDAAADVAEVDAGFAIEADKIAERGYDPDDFLRRQKEWRQKKDKVLGPPPAPDPPPQDSADSGGSEP